MADHEPEENSQGGNALNQTEFGHFIESQISGLIEKERHENVALNREQELGIAIDFCKRFLIEGEQKRQQKDSFNSAEEDEDGQMKENLAEKSEDIPHLTDEEKQRRAEVLTKLVELKLELEQYKESLELSSTSDVEPMEKVKGHEFVMQPVTGRNAYCEACLGTIWRMVQKWRRCKVCTFRVHDKCLNRVRRPCVSLKLAHPDFALLFQLCPEQSLRDQNFQCAECAAPISYDEESEKVPRLCDYTGYLYCRNCHWNDEMVIPARLVRNWDTEKRPVCRATKQLLNTIRHRPLIDLSKENPMLFKYVHIVNKMNRLRGIIMLMKCYLVCCKAARKLRILQHLNRHQHFVESDSLYTMEDLVQLESGRLLPEIEAIVQIFQRHITKECEICQGNAFFCELCAGNERIYPFSEDVAICKGCMACFHRPCFDQQSRRCPRCARRRSRRKAILQEENEEKIFEEKIEEK